MKKLLISILLIFVTVLMSAQRRESSAYYTFVGDTTLTFVFTDNLDKIGITVTGSSTDSCAVYTTNTFTASGTTLTADSIRLPATGYLGIGEGEAHIRDVTIHVRTNCIIWLVLTRYIGRL